MRGRERGDIKTCFGGVCGIRLIFQGHSPGGATVCVRERAGTASRRAIIWQSPCNVAIGQNFSDTVYVVHAVVVAQRVF